MHLLKLGAERELRRRRGRVLAVMDLVHRRTRRDRSGWEVRSSRRKERLLLRDWRKRGLVG